jgi:hypothetical protein
LCHEQYADAPEVKIVLPDAVESTANFTYVPSHAYHILFELLKNSCTVIVSRQILHSRSAIIGIHACCWLEVNIRV